MCRNGVSIVCSTAGQPARLKSRPSKPSSGTGWGRGPEQYRAWHGPVLRGFSSNVRAGRHEKLSPVPPSHLQGRARWLGRAKSFLLCPGYSQPWFLPGSLPRHSQSAHSPSLYEPLLITACTYTCPSPAPKLPYPELHFIFVHTTYYFLT